MPRDYIDFVTISTMNCWDKTKKAPRRPTTTAGQFGKQMDKLKKTKIHQQKYPETNYKQDMSTSKCFETNIAPPFISLS